MQMPNQRRIRQILAGAILVACVPLAGIVVVRQFRATPPESASQKLSPELDMAMSRLRFSEMRGGVKLWELVADRAVYDKEPGQARLTGVRLELFEGKADGVVITSESGNYRETDKVVRMSGKVHAVTKRGMVFDTDELEYRTAAGMIVTDKELTVVDGRLRLKARGMELLVNEENVRFLQQVDAVLEGKHENR